MKKYWPWLILGLLVVLASWPLWRAGFIPTHDGEYHLIRFWQFDKNFRSGRPFSRWAPDLDHGFGAPLFNFFYPLPNYGAEIFLLLGASLADSFKFSLALTLILSTLFFYLWLKELFGSWPALVGAVFYLYAPYHFVDAYIRGSVGEAWALVWLAAILWAWEKRRLALAGLFFALLILSHNILAMIFSVFLVSYLVFCRPTSEESWLSPPAGGFSLPPSEEWLSGVSLILGLGLSAYFWLPALVEKRFVRGLELINYSDHFPAFFQLVFPSWGNGFSVSGIMDGMSFQVGLVHWLVVLTSLVVIWRQKILSSKPVFFLTWFIFLVFLMLEISLPLWRFFPWLAYLQYPWRLLSLMMLITSFLAGWLVGKLKKRWLTLALLAAVLLCNWRYSRPVIYPARDNGFYLNNPDWTQGTATLGNSFQTIWANHDQPAEQKTEFQENNRLRFNINYYPGWQVLVSTKGGPASGWNGQKQLLEIEPDGAFSIAAVQGEGKIRVNFTETPLRLFSDGLSLISFLLLVLLLFKNK